MKWPWVYFSQQKVGPTWSSSTTRGTRSSCRTCTGGQASRPVVLITDNCSGDGKPADPTRQGTVIALLPNSTARRQPMDKGVIAVFKVQCRCSLLLTKQVATLEMRTELRKSTATRKMAGGTTGLGEGHEPHVLDAIELGVEVWAATLEETVARCWLKADISC
ncbi:unnamed protein product [Phaeothamnion confervicola]